MKVATFIRIRNREPRGPFLKELHKALIERIISEEDKKKPLSDQRIANMLEEKGFQIARRTVTKYREQQGIPVARLRKEIVLS